MKKIGMLKGLMLCRRYRRMDDVARAELRARRLQSMVAWARANSPYYEEHYRGLPAAYTLADLPPVNKVDLMARWDDWITDRSVSFADVSRFMENNDNIGRKLNGKYWVFTTSGSTGDPLVMLCDNTVMQVMGAVNLDRSFARWEDMKRFIKRGGKTIGVFATGGFYLSNGSLRARLLQMPWKKRQMAITSALLPTETIVAQLNAFQPAMLGGYPTSLELLIDEQRSGRLHIHPVLIMTGGEHLSDDLRQRLSQTFSCYTQTQYACTEGGTVAFECREQRFHINDDWLLVEPVNSKGQPVPDGVLSDKLLLTNLYNVSQPFIRYEVTDRVALHREPCPCGCRSPWLTLDGRTDDVLTFVQNGREVRVAPLPLYATLKEVRSLRRFQLLSHPEQRLTLRLVPVEGMSRMQAFSEAKAALLSFLRTQGVETVSVDMADDLPAQHAQSGKFKHIVRL